MNSLREKTLAQALLIEFASAQDGITASPAYQVLSAVVNRARGMEEQQLRILRATTPPAQAAEAVAAVQRVAQEMQDRPWITPTADDIHSWAGELMAAIATMQEGEGE